MITLQRKFEIEKPSLPKSRMSRWAEFSWCFDYKEKQVIPAKDALYNFRCVSCLLWSKQAWKEEYRFHRKLLGITRGKDYEKCESSTTRLVDEIKF